MAAACRACRASQLIRLIDFGPHPVCSHFLLSPDAADVSYPLLLARCGGCGTVQVADPPPIEQLLPRHSWIRYNEPERHLDSLADSIGALPQLSGTVAGGVGAHDEPLLARLAARGFSTWHLDTKSDLGIDSSAVNAAAVQDRLTPERARCIAARRGGASLVVSRYTYEHAFDPVGHLSALGELAGPRGLVLLEVPDCTDAFRTRDYTTLWEEHVLYLMPQALRRALAASGWDIVWLHSYPGALHNALVAVVRRSPTCPAADAAAADGEAALAAGFADAFPRIRSRVRQWFQRYRASGGRVALFGAGHVGLTYLTVMGIAQHVEFAVDDNPHKQGLVLPGVRLPIRPSSALAEEGISMTLMAVSPDNEPAVLRRLEDYRRAGGSLASIFPVSRYALPVYEE